MEVFWLGYKLGKRVVFAPESFPTKQRRLRLQPGSSQQPWWKQQAPPRVLALPQLGFLLPKALGFLFRHSENLCPGRSRLLEDRARQNAG